MKAEDWNRKHAGFALLFGAEPNLTETQMVAYRGMTDEQFQQEMVDRVAATPGRDIYPGCPLCSVVAKTSPQPAKPTRCGWI